MFFLTTAGFVDDVPAPLWLRVVAAVLWPVSMVLFVEERPDGS